MKVSFFQRLTSKRKRLDRLRKTVIDYYSGFPTDELDPDQKEILRHLQDHCVSVFPYKFPEKYVQDDIDLVYDDSHDLFYTLWEGKKLYYRDGKNPVRARKYFHSLLVEQDVRSPHRYLTGTFDVKENDVVVDIGAAEGNFALTVVEKAAFVFLFEAEKKWRRALEATFRPWRHKVEIVEKYVSDQNDEYRIALDDFFVSDQKVNFIKADVEGAEADVIRGARKLIERQRDLKVALCTYHRQEDAEDLSAMLEEMNFQNSFSDGYMLFYYGRENVVKPPFLRKGILRAIK